MRIAVCVITYQRPEGLKRLLEGLAGLTFGKIGSPDLRIVVVDNDAAGSARVLYESLAPDFPWPLTYHVEPRRGIPFARNASVAAAGDADFLVFVDDDEVPEPGWIEELLRVQRATGADVVAGPALPYFDGAVPDWVVKSKFFERARFATGTAVAPAFVATNNVLVRRGVLEEVAQGGQVFDERYAMSGGSDTNLFMRVHRAGHRMVWADGAVARDRIPASRARVSWILQRAYRFGNTLALCERDLDPSARTWLARIVKGGGHVVQGLLLLPLAVLGRHALVGALRRVCRGAGMLSGTLGLRYQEYRRKTHGA
jgi:succinoglycan biosynthesis protein ExoM